MTAQRIRLLICSSCLGTRDRETERQAVSAALDKAGIADRVELTEHACFSACEQPVAVGLQGQGLASYVFSGLDLAQDAADIAGTCRTYLDSSLGWIEDARPCGRLRLCLRTRMPALQST